MHSLRKNENISMLGKRIAPRQKKLLPFLPGSLLKARFKDFLMLAKARKSSFNANIGEFCSVTFFVCLLFFYGASNYFDIFRIQAYAIRCVN